VAAGGGDAGVPGHFQDPDAEIAQGGHGLGPAAGADLGGVFAVADVAVVCSTSICQRPRLHCASRARAAGTGIGLVIACTVTVVRSGERAAIAAMGAFARRR
jgi:hypothetical protein